MTDIIQLNPKIHERIDSPKLQLKQIDTNVEQLDDSVEVVDLRIALESLQLKETPTETQDEATDATVESTPVIDAVEELNKLTLNDAKTDVLNEADGEQEVESREKESESEPVGNSNTQVVTDTEPKKPEQPESNESTSETGVNTEKEKHEDIKSECEKAELEAPLPASDASASSDIPHNLDSSPQSTEQAQLDGEETDLDLKLKKLDLNEVSSTKLDEKEKSKSSEPSISLTEKSIGTQASVEDIEEIEPQKETPKEEDKQTDEQTTKARSPPDGLPTSFASNVKETSENRSLAERAPVHGIASSYAANQFGGVDPNHIPRLKVTDPCYEQPQPPCINLTEKLAPSIALQPVNHNNNRLKREAPDPFVTPNRYIRTHAEPVENDDGGVSLEVELTGGNLALLLNDQTDLGFPDLTPELTEDGLTGHEATVSSESGVITGLDPDTLDFVLENYSPKSDTNAQQIAAENMLNLSPPHSVGTNAALSPSHPALSPTYQALSPPYQALSPNYQEHSPTQPPIDCLSNQSSPMTAPIMSPDPTCMYSPPHSGNESSPPHIADISSYMYSPQSDQNSQYGPFSPDLSNNSSRQTFVSTSDASMAPDCSSPLPTDLSDDTTFMEQLKMAEEIIMKDAGMAPPKASPYDTPSDSPGTDSTSSTNGDSNNYGVPSPASTVCSTDSDDKPPEANNSSKTCSKSTLDLLKKKIEMKNGNAPTPKRKILKAQPHPKSSRDILKQYRPIMPLPSQLSEMAGPAPSARPLTQQQKQENEKLMKARRTVASISSEKLKKIDEDGDSILQFLCYEEFMTELIETLEESEDEEDEESTLSMGIMKGPYIVRAVVERMKREGILDDVINKTNNQGQTPLLLACITTQPQIAKVLLENGADPNQNAYRHTQSDTKRFFGPLHFVAERAQFTHEVLKVLLDHGKTDVNKQNELMETPLHCAIRCHGAAYANENDGRHSGIRDSRATVDLLLKKGAVFKQGPNDQTPLHYLASVDMTRHPDGFLSFVKFVMEKIPMEKRRDLLSQNSDRGTVLHIVAAKRFDNDKERQIILDTLKYLIKECNADPTVKDKSDFPIKRNVHRSDKVVLDYLSREIKNYRRQLNNHRVTHSQFNNPGSQVLPLVVSDIPINSSQTSPQESVTSCTPNGVQQVRMQNPVPTGGMNMQQPPCTMGQPTNSALQQNIQMAMQQNGPSCMYVQQNNAAITQTTQAPGSDQTILLNALQGKLRNGFAADTAMTNGYVNNTAPIMNNIGFNGQQPTINMVAHQPAIRHGPSPTMMSQNHVFVTRPL